MAWILSKLYINSIIIGANSMRQLDDNLNAVDVDLHDDEVEALDG
ncbi:MAG: aldo/keto reductase [Desulfobacterales bacterium]